MPVIEDVYDYASRTLTAGSALDQRGRSSNSRRDNLEARIDDLQELLEGDEWKSPLDFEYKIVFRVSIFIGYLARFQPIVAFSWNIFLLRNLDGIHFYESIVVH